MIINRIAIIGYTGLIGSNLYTQYKSSHKYIDLYNSKNIAKIKKDITYEIVFCAGLPAEKWKANKHPKKDKVNTLKLIKNLQKINTKKLVLISTIDINFKHNYGKNRKLFENFVKDKFKEYLILRLPAVFGPGLKKNIIFDLINKNELNKIYLNDKYQWYDLLNLKKDITKIKKNKKRIHEFYSEPIETKEIINLFKLDYVFEKRMPPTIYNFKPSTGYFNTKKNILKGIKKFIKQK